MPLRTISMSKAPPISPSTATMPRNARPNAPEVSNAFAQRHELDIARIEFVDDLQEVLSGACESVARPDEQHVEAPPPSVLHPVERGAACFRPTKPWSTYSSSFATLSPLLTRQGFGALLGSN